MKKGIIKTLLFVALLVLAVVIGKILGGAFQNIPWLAWLGAGAGFGISPVTVDLAILQFTFGMTVQINAAQAILLLAAIFTYLRIK